MVVLENILKYRHNHKIKGAKNESINFRWWQGL